MIGFYLSFSAHCSTRTAELLQPANRGRCILSFCLWGLWLVFFYIVGNFACLDWQQRLESNSTIATSTLPPPDYVRSEQTYVFRKKPLPEQAPSVSEENTSDDVEEQQLEIPATEYRDDDQEGKGDVPDTRLRQRVRDALQDVTR
ncbi:hypothetical protein [Yokenella regensburgei]|uniref:hypothetical protein n=1 Tax=Yokenella regensburgei TaxID=158877 RepID=UPI003ED8FE23